jgi:hypothetical protein
MAYGAKGENKMPPGRKPFGMTTNTTGRTFDQAGPKMRVHAGTNYNTEVIRPHHHADGQDADGTPAEHVHGKANAGYLDAASLEYRASLRGHTSKKGHSNHG